MGDNRSVNVIYWSHVLKSPITSRCASLRGLPTKPWKETNTHIPEFFSFCGAKYIINQTACITHLEILPVHKKVILLGGEGSLIHPQKKCFTIKPTRERKINWSSLHDSCNIFFFFSLEVFFFFMMYQEMYVLKICALSIYDRI